MSAFVAFAETQLVQAETGGARVSAPAAPPSAATQLVQADTASVHPNSPAALASARAPATPAPVGPAVPSLLPSIGRFTVLERVGEGAVGIVYAAYDDQLDRKVAVKILRGDTDRADPLARDRMLREAQALARLSHPNIVAVHEVGWHNGQMFIAMEFVRGQNLSAWLQAEPRPWREVVGVMLQAGRGLAAAHAAGIVHRDFKPANTLVAADGVVKVVDFGLARAIGEPVTRRDPLTSSSGALLRSSQLEVDLTSTGFLVGTPAYMAPEQHAERPAADKSDQFSFCVTLYQALYGQHPFDTSSIFALQRAVTLGKMRPPPAHAQVPAALLQVITRGLSVEPERRFPSMPALLAALERLLRPRRRPWWIAAAVAGLIGAAGVGAASAGDAADPCESAGRELAGLWDASTAAAVHAGLAATGLPYADDTWDRVRPQLDAYAQKLVDTRVDACRDFEDGRASLHLYDMRSACLDERHASLGALVEIFQRADAGVVDEAVAAVQSLPALASCRDTQALTSAAALPSEPGAVAQIVEVRRGLARVLAHELAGQVEEGMPLLEQARAQAPDHAPLRAELALREGSLLARAGRDAEADAALTEGLRLAIASGHHLVAAELATRREYIRAAKLQRAVDVLRDAPVIEGLSARVAARGGGALFHGDHSHNLGVAHAVLGEHEVAREYFTQSIAARRAVLGDDHPQVVKALGELGRTLAAGRHLDEGARMLREAKDLAEQTLGPGHPELARLASDLGEAERRLGRYREAGTHLEQALALQSALVGHAAPELHRVLTALGGLALEQRRCEDAADRFQRALAVQRAGQSADDPTPLDALVGLGEAHACAGRFDEARPRLVHAVGLAERAYGADDPRLAPILDAFGAMSLQSGDLEAAETSHRRALALRERALAPDAPELARSYAHLAELELRKHHPKAAEEALRRALELTRASAGGEGLPAASLYLRLGELALARGHAQVAHGEFERAAAIYAARSDPGVSGVAAARFGMARALAALHGRSAEVRSLAAEALAGYKALGAGWTREAEAVQAWLGPSTG